jgi:predicted MFS family arabinose efflux permease
VTDDALQGRRSRTFLALAPVYLSVFFFVAGNSALQILVPVFLARREGLGPAAIGGVLGVFGIASLAARLPTGFAYTVARGRSFMLAGGAISAAAFALVPVVHGSFAFAALMLVNGVGWSVATTAQLALLVARPPGGVSTAAAMGWFSGATGLGNAAAGVLGGVTADVVGLRTTFFVLAVTPLLGALLMARGVASSSSLRGAGVPGVVPERTGSMWRLLTRTPIAVWSGVLVMFFINALNGVTNTFQPVMCVAAGLTLTQIGALSSIRSWASSSSRLGSGPLFARYDLAGLTLPLVIAGTVSTAVIPDVRASFLLQIPLFVIAGVSRGLLRVTGSADAFDSVGADDRRHGLTSALLYGGLDLGKIAGPVVGGAVAAAWGIPTMFRVVPLALLALYLVLIAAARRARSATPAVPSERRAAP